MKLSESQIQKLEELIAYYFEENYFRKTHEKEKEGYKWEAMKLFQMEGVTQASNKNFFIALKKALKNLLFQTNQSTLFRLAAAYDEELRIEFQKLAQGDRKDLKERISNFLSATNAMIQRDKTRKWTSLEAADAMTCLAFLQPDKYYIYRPMVLDAAYEFLGKPDTCSNKAVDRACEFHDLCELILQYIREHHADKFEQYLDFVRSNEMMYADESGHLLVQNLLYALKLAKEAWKPGDFTPDLTVETWVELLQDSSVFTENALQIVKRMKDYGGQATCTQLSMEYGKAANFYNAGSVALAKRIVKKTNCPTYQANDESTKWWPILYVGKKADAATDGEYIWKLRDELSEALEQVDLSAVSLYVDDKLSVQEPSLEAKNYWWLTANPKIWSYADIKIGEEQSYTLYNENGNKRRIFQNFLDARVGDVVIGYEANPTKKIVALARITRENDGQSLYFEKTEVLSEPIEYATLKECPELEKMEFFIQPNGSLFRLTKEEFDFIMDVVREENPLEKQDVATPKYTKEDFLNEVFMTAAQYDELKDLLLNKMNVILQGAPGVGKTFSAKRLAYSIMGEKDDSRIEMVQFHQNYSYEDFIMGYRPYGETFNLSDGIFKRFCQKALLHPDKAYFFIIDEINRGNMSKIFGELLMLIEKDYRGTKATLAYNGMSFSVPKNIYIIGMMNTADRSLAMIDYALRRRFSFFEIEPGFESDGFKKYQKQFFNDGFDQLIEHIKSLNEEISDDKSLGKGFRIGHSYFCGKEADQCTDAWMRAVVKFDILPMLSEYWFDEPDKIKHWEEKLAWYVQ